MAKIRLAKAQLKLLFFIKCLIKNVEIQNYCFTRLAIRDPKLLRLHVVHVALLDFVV